MGKHKDSLPGGQNPSRARRPNGTQGSTHPGGWRGRNLEQRQASAKERDEHRASLSDKEQLAVLDRRLGKGLGAQKERARLHARIKG
jgi:hypothetical protein